MIFNEGDPQPQPGLEPITISEKGLNELIAVAQEHGSWVAAGTPYPDETDLIAITNDIEIEIPETVDEGGQKVPRRYLSIDIYPDGIVDDFEQTIGQREFSCNYAAHVEDGVLKDETCLISFNARGETAAALGDDVERVYGILKRERSETGTEYYGHLQINFTNNIFINWGVRRIIDLNGNIVERKEYATQRFQVPGGILWDLQEAQKRAANPELVSSPRVLEDLSTVQQLYRRFEFEFSVGEGEVPQVSLSNRRWRLESYLKEVIPRAVENAARMMTAESRPALLLDSSIKVRREEESN